MALLWTHSSRSVSVCTEWELCTQLLISELRSGSPRVPLSTRECTVLFRSWERETSPSCFPSREGAFFAARLGLLLNVQLPVWSYGEGREKEKCSCRISEFIHMFLFYFQQFHVYNRSYLWVISNCSYTYIYFLICYAIPEISVTEGDAEMKHLIILQSHRKLRCVYFFRNGVCVITEWCLKADSERNEIIIERRRGGRRWGGEGKQRWIFGICADGKTTANHSSHVSAGKHSVEKLKYRWIKKCYK